MSPFDNECLVYNSIVVVRQVAYFKGDPRKPVVLLYPDLSATTSSNMAKGKEAKGSGGGRFVVRLLPCCGRDVMGHSRLGPGRNNVRTRWVGLELRR